MKLIKIIAVNILITLSIYSYGQLQGTYTIGGSNADYRYLTNAITVLYSQGMTGDVTFILNPGHHSGTTFTAIPGASDSCRLTIQSLNLDSTEVNFNQTIGFHEASHITIKAITITAENIRGIDFYRSNDIIIENCCINSIGSNPYNRRPIYIEHFNSGGFSSITITNCLVNSSEPCITCINSMGITTIDNCVLNSIDWVSVSSYYHDIRLYLTNSILNGGIDVRIKNQLGVLNGNEINGEVYIGAFDSVMDNTFTGDIPTHITSNYFEGNRFASSGCGSGGHYGSNGSSTFVNNIFECPISIGHATNITMIGNTFHKNISLGFNKRLIFLNNRVYADFNFGTVTSTYKKFTVQNNIFSGGGVRGGHHANISYNNFVDSAYLYVDYGDVNVHDNNFCRGIRGAPSTHNVYHNNYFPLIYCYYDTLSTHYNPEYDPDKVGIATNPILQGKGLTESPDSDILENLRQFPPAIGANEIFICSDSSNNNITIPCGEELFLNLCNVPDTGTFWWTPDSCVINPDSLYTSMYPYNNQTLYLNNSIYGLIDSVYIHTVPFQVEIASMPMFYCGYPMTLNATYHPSASYHWTPEEGLSDPYIRNPLLSLNDTINLQYTLECQIDNCGVSYDTITIDFDPLPIVGIYYPEQIYDTLFFNCLSSCVDEYLWDFGDGTTSTLENPSHVYQENGSYVITLTGTNQFGSRSSTVYYCFYYVSVNEDTEKHSVQIYPNPAHNEININGLNESVNSEIKITDITGNEVLKSIVKSSQAKIHVQDLKSGLYLIWIKSEGETIINKVIIN